MNFLGAIKNVVCRNMHQNSANRVSDFTQVSYRCGVDLVGQDSPLCCFCAIYIGVGGGVDDVLYALPVIALHAFLVCDV